MQQPDLQPRHNNRGVFTTGADGRYWFEGIKPVSYPIPDDGPVGQMLGNLGRHPFRPAHMHFIISAEGYDRVTTHTFVAGDDYLQSDAVFGVKETLIAGFEPVVNGASKWRSTYDFVLSPIWCGECAFQARGATAAAGAQGYAAPLAIYSPCEIVSGCGRKGGSHAIHFYQRAWPDRAHGVASMGQWPRASAECGLGQ